MVSPLAVDVAYVEGCPGCRMDRRKAACEGIPYREFFYLWAVTLCSRDWHVKYSCRCFNLQIRDLHIAKREEDIGYYAGFVGSSYMVGRALTSLYWGIMADRYGRKPVALFGIISVVIFNTIFGLSTNYWMAITARFLLGCLNGVLGPMKAYASEVCRKEHQVLGLSLVNTAISLGLIIGPSIGGFLAQPAEKFPHTFSKDSIFGRFPYFLPCLCVSVFAGVVFIASLWLPETLHMHHREKGRGSYVAVKTTEHGPDLEENKNKMVETSPIPKENLFKNWPLMSAITVYCIISLHNMAYTEIFSLWAVSDKKYGGLSFSTRDVGGILMLTGCSLLIFQLLIYPKIDKRLGSVPTARMAGIISIPLLFAYPYFNRFTRFHLLLVVSFSSVLKNILAVTMITSLFILQNTSVEQHQRGAANGISMTAMSVFKAIAPAGGGAIFSWAQKRQSASFFPGDSMVFFVLNMVQLLGLLLMFEPFLVQPNI